MDLIGGLLNGRLPRHCLRRCAICSRLPQPRPASAGPAYGLQVGAKCQVALAARRLPAPI